MSRGLSVREPLFWLLFAASAAFIAPVRAYLFIAGLTFVTAVLIFRGALPGDRRFIVTVFILSCLARWLLSVSFTEWAYISGRNGFISGDERLYSLTALDVLGQIRAGTFIYHIVYFGYNLYTYMLAFFYGVFGYHLCASKLLNGYIGSLVPVVGYYIGMRSGLSAFANRAFSVFLAIYPSFVYWSTYNIKEPVIILSMCAGYLILLKALDRSLTVGDIVCCMLLAVAVINIQPLYIYIVGLIFAVCVARYCSRTFAVTLALAAAVAAAVFVARKPEMWQNLLGYFEMHQWNMAIQDKAGYYLYPLDFRRELICGRIDCAALAISYVKGAAYFLFTPLPWKISSLGQLAALPQTCLWYGTLALACVGLFRGWRRSAGMVCAFFVFVGVAYSFWALTEGNAGAAFRHRDHFAAVVFVFSFMGIDELSRQANNRRGTA